MVLVLKKKYLIIIVIIQIGLIGLFSMMTKSHMLTNDNTKEYIATFNYIQLNSSNDKTEAFISINEYDTLLYIPKDIFENIHSNKMMDIKKGQEISFRIENHYIEQFGSAPILSIVELKTTNNVIYSIEEYNIIIKKTIIPPKVICVIAFFSLSLIFFKIKKRLQ